MCFTGKFVFSLTVIYIRSSLLTLLVNIQFWDLWYLWRVCPLNSVVAITCAAFFYIVLLLYIFHCLLWHDKSWMSFSVNIKNKNAWYRGAWVTRLVKCLTLDFYSGQDLGVMRSTPASDFLSPSALPLPLLHFFFLNTWYKVTKL